MMTAAMALRDGLDGELAMLMRDDPEYEDLNGLVDQFDAAMSRLSAWLKSSEEEGEGENEASTDA
jgi:hypothetical protein